MTDIMLLKAIKRLKEDVENVSKQPGPQGEKGENGARGERGERGEKGERGQDGYTPQKNIDYFDGKDGRNGKDGYTPQKDVDYFDGKDGKDGQDGKNGADGVGIKDVKLKNGVLTVYLTDGQEIKCGKIAMPYVGGGISVTNCQIKNNHLFVTLSNGREIDCGAVGGGQGGVSVNDVIVNGESVLEGNRAIIDLTPYAKTEDIPTLPTNVSAFTNDAGYLTEHQDISGKYDKTGGEISGDVKVDGNLTFDIEDEDYDAGIKFIAKPLDTNRGTILKLQGYANSEGEDTNYKVVIENVGTPTNNFDAANKKYVDDKTSITWITGFYDEQGLYVSSSAYNDCYSGVTSNHTVYLKITEANQVSILRLKAWKNFNEHSSGGDSFFFVDAIDLSTNKTATITNTSATFDTLDIEVIGNKKTGVDANKDSDTYYPTTKATYDFVQDEFDRRKPVVVWETDGTTGLLGLNTDWSADTGWQVENVDMTPFKRVKFYVKPNRDSASKNRLTPPAICEVFLDDRSTSEYTSGEYIGTYLGANPADHNVLYSCIFVVSADKTKFKFQTQNSLYGTTKGGRNDNGRFCYLCEGYYD